MLKSSADFVCADQQGDVLDSDLDPTPTASDEDELEEAHHPFTFSQAGQSVAVFYDDDFHVGNVTNVLSEESAEVNFMKKCVVTSNTYVWPATPDTDIVKAQFVFFADFDITTSNGRIWSVTSDVKLGQKYAAFKKRYC